MRLRSYNGEGLSLDNGSITWSVYLLIDHYFYSLLSAPSSVPITDFLLLLQTIDCHEYWLSTASRSSAQDAPTDFSRHCYPSTNHTICKGDEKEVTCITANVDCLSDIKMIDNTIHLWCVYSIQNPPILRWFNGLSIVSSKTDWPNISSNDDRYFHSGQDQIFSRSLRKGKRKFLHESVSIITSVMP